MAGQLPQLPLTGFCCEVGGLEQSLDAEALPSALFRSPVCGGQVR